MRSRVFSIVSVFFAVMLVMTGVSFAGDTILVSINDDGTQSSTGMYIPQMTPDGRYIVFYGSGLAGDTTPYNDAYLYDKVTDMLRIVSIYSDGSQISSNSVSTAPSNDGRFIAFQGTPTYVYLHDRDVDEDGIFDEPGEILSARISTQNSYPTAISGNGRFVLYVSDSPIIVPGDTNGVTDVFVYDSVNGTTERVNVSSNGTQANGDSGWRGGISYDGRYVAFQSDATNLVPNDNNHRTDVFVRDRLTNTTELISIGDNGQQGNEPSIFPKISADGSRVVFESLADNFVSGDINETYDIFLRDRSAGITQLISMSSTEAQGNGQSRKAEISSNGKYVIFESYSNNLVEGDTNGYSDVFIHDVLNGVTERVSLDSNGIQGNSNSTNGFVSDDARVIAFASSATNLDPADTNGGVADVFVRIYANDEDSDGFTYEQECNDFDSTIYPGAIEVCDGQDNNCDGTTDEGCPVNTYYRDADSDVFGDAADTINSTLPTPPQGYVNDNTDCNDNDASVYPGAPETKHDGTDQDCNGYDLTIDITLAEYRTNQDKLTVIATSDYNDTANLSLDGYGPMSWISNKLWWEIDVKPAGGNPGTVIVSGPEGSETATVQVQ